MKSVTATATSTISTHRPIPAAAFSLMPKIDTSLSVASMMSVIGEMTHRKVAIALFGAASFLSLRYSDASASVTRRSACASSSAVAASSGSSNSSLRR